MESISAGGGTQEVFLKLDWTTLVNAENAQPEPSQAETESSVPEESSQSVPSKGGLNNKPLVFEDDTPKTDSSLPIDSGNTPRTGETESAAGLGAMLLASVGAAFAALKKRKTEC